jgi:succinate-acetate transporter protein
VQVQGAFCISLCDQRWLEDSNELHNNTDVMSTLNVTNYTYCYIVRSSPFVINFVFIVILLLYLHIHHHCLSIQSSAFTARPESRQLHVKGTIGAFGPCSSIYTTYTNVLKVVQITQYLHFVSEAMIYIR